MVPVNLDREDVSSSFARSSANLGVDVLLEVLESEGIRHVFGNPGTTELPLIAALAGGGGPSYVLCLHEGVAVGMADGHARATGRPSFVNLHTAAGLGNSMGVLSNAVVTRTPMVVTAGQQDSRQLMAEPFLSGSLAEMAAGVVKRASEVHRVDDLGLLCRRAFRDAVSEPPGPVFLSLPMDLLQTETTAPVPPRSVVSSRTVPAEIGELARMIVQADRARFAVVAGDEVATSGALESLVRVAEKLGCVVYGTPMHSDLVFPTTHRLWGGALPADAVQMRAMLADYERLLVIGSRPFMTFMHRDAWPVPESVKLCHLAPSPTDLGRTYRAALGVVGDPAATLDALEPLLAPLAPADVAAARRAVEAASLERTASVERAVAEAEAAGEAGGRLHPLAAVRAVVAALPRGTSVVDEAVTNDPYVRMLLRADRAGGFFYSRGGGLGWGVAAAMGVSLARDRSPVAAITGDGSFLYGPQALWTAKREDIPVVAIVLNNGGYLILQRLLSEVLPEVGDASKAPGLVVDEPPVDIAALGRAFGCRAVRVSRLDEVGDAVRAAFEGSGPHLVEVPVSSPEAG